MKRIASDDAEVVYKVVGDGPPVVLLHPFPAHHELWLPAAEDGTRIGVVTLRAISPSEIGSGKVLPIGYPFKGSRGALGQTH